MLRSGGPPGASKEAEPGRSSRMRTLPAGSLRWRFLPLLANTEAPQRILVMKQKTAAEHFRRALKRIADFGWIRKSPLAPTAHSVTPPAPKACAAIEHRSLADGMAVTPVPIATGRDHHRPAGKRDPLAPTRLPCLLAPEVSPRRRQSTD